MTRPLFSIDEPVILLSEDMPSANGDYRVIAINQCAGEILFHPSSGEDYHREYSLSYSLGVLNSKGFDAWEESALRKRPEPSTISLAKIMDIEELMKNYQPEKV